MATDAKRRAELGKIHIARKQLNLDEDTYRAMLFTVARVRSARDLDEGGRRKVLEHLRARGFRSKRAGRPHNIDSKDRGPQLKKIEALLSEAKRPWSYADGIAQQMFHVDRVALCAPAQLRSLIAALVKDAARHGRRTA